jgi:zinc protease
MTRLIPAVLALVLAAPPPLSAQPATAPTLPAGPLPVDPAVTMGGLPNGLRYYVRRNTRPEKRVLLWLAVKTGSIYEADDQRGLAHLLEHMAFNGTTHFEPGELVSFFETAGARFGPHVNAYTSFDETVYMLQVPTDKEGLVDKGMLALADFAGGMTLAPEEVDKERGVVIEEWRLRQGASWRILEKQAPVLYYKSRYAERIPIGTPEILRTFPVARLKDFYESWYRPDRMSVVVVGDVDPAAIVPKIAELFGALKPARAAAPEPDKAVPDHAETLVNVTADPEAQSSGVSVLHKRPKLPEGTVEDYRRDLVRQLMYQILNLRFSEITQRPDAPFLGAGAGTQELGATTIGTSLGARVTDGGLARGRCWSRHAARASSASPTASWTAPGARCWQATSARSPSARRPKAAGTHGSTSATSSTASRFRASRRSSRSPRRCSPVSPSSGSARPRASCSRTPAASSWPPRPRRRA